MIWWFQHNTYGINCDQCAAGYYRPYGVLKNDTNACRRKWRCSFTALSVECWVITCDWLTSMYDLWPFSLWLWPERVYRGVWGRVGTMFVSQGIHRPLLWQVSNSSLKPQCLGTQNMFPGNSIVCLVSVNRESDCCNGSLLCSCAPGYEGYPTCVPCQCHMNGTDGEICSLEGGQPCPCKENFVGNRCDMCASGYYNFPECTRKSKRFAGFIAFFSWWNKCTILICEICC